MPLVGCVCRVFDDRVFTEWMAMTDPDTILLEAEEAMSKAVDYLGHELRGVRTGRATTALVEYVKVDYYGSSTDLKTNTRTRTPHDMMSCRSPRR